jgi:hypothetical protein
MCLFGSTAGSRSLDRLMRDGLIPFKGLIRSHAADYDEWAREIGVLTFRSFQVPPQPLKQNSVAVFP